MFSGKVVISQPMYFPWLGLFEQIHLCDQYVNYDDVQFSKGSFTNRVQIKTEAGTRWLTVPLQNHSLGASIDQTEIDQKSDWRSEHCRILKSSYSKSPYFRDMMRIVEGVFDQRFSSVGEISWHSMQACTNYYGIYKNKVFHQIKELNVPGSSSQRVLDVVIKLNGSSYLTGHGAKNYLDHERFEKAGINVEYIRYKMAQYPQAFGSFNPYVSLLDLIANTGPEGIKYFQSTTQDWREFTSS
jgi:hypothetical protein